MSAKKCHHTHCIKKTTDASGFCGVHRAAGAVQGTPKKPIRIKPLRIEGTNTGVKLFDESGSVYELSNLDNDMARQLVRIISLSEPTSTSEWSCSQCTFLNEGSHICEMCENPEPKTGTNSGPAPEATDEGESQAVAVIDDGVCKEGGSEEGDMGGDPIPASALAADGTSYSLGMLHPGQTVLQAKQLLANVSEFSVSTQALFLIDDTRDNSDLQLKNEEKISAIVKYSASDTKLQFAIMVGLENSVVDFLIALPPSSKPQQIGNGVSGTHDAHLQTPFAAVFVPTHMDIVIAVPCGQNHVRVYRLCPGTAPVLLCKFGSKGCGEGQFSSPRGAAVTADGEHVIVVDHSNDRMQVLKLVVAPNSSTARLEFERCIGGTKGTGPGTVGPCTVGPLLF
jgi:hypothetical protein